MRFCVRRALAAIYRSLSILVREHADTRDSQGAAVEGGVAVVVADCWNY